MKLKSHLLAILFVVPIVGDPSSAHAADTGLFLQEVSRSGPTRFVKWAEQYYSERKQGKSGFQASGEQTGKVLGALVGGSLGLLSDDPIGGIKEGAKSGVGYGGGLGEAMGKTVGSEELEELITDYMNDREPLLEEANQIVQSCVSKGIAFSTCRRSQNISNITAEISQLNNNYCRKAIAIRQPKNPSQPILVPNLCQNN
jgi:hypothetical protein